MSDEQLEDLKQFIDSRISQSESLTREEIANLKEETKNGFSGVADSLDHLNQVIDEHEQRIAKFEQKVA